MVLDAVRKCMKPNFPHFGRNFMHFEDNKIHHFQVFPGLEFAEVMEDTKICTGFAETLTTFVKLHCFHDLKKN